MRPNLHTANHFQWGLNPDANQHQFCWEFWSEFSPTFIERLHLKIRTEKSIDLSMYRCIDLSIPNKKQDDRLRARTWIIPLWFFIDFFLLLYIEWNNINSSIFSFMFDHRFIPHHKFSVTSLFPLRQSFFFFLEQNKKYNKLLIRLIFCMTAVNEKRRRERERETQGEWKVWN